VKRSLTFSTASALVVTTCLVVAAASREPATVKLVDETVTLFITFDNNRTLKVTSKGTKLPAGTHWIKSLRFTKEDEKGRTWELRTCGERLGGVKNITVASGQEKIIDPGPPIALHLWCKQGDPPNDGEVTLTFTAVGKYDAVYYPGAFLYGKRPPAPVFRIITESGKTVHQGRFDVTESNGGCRYVWRRPPGFKGKYKVEVKCSFGPFEYKSNREGHFFEIK